MTEHYATIKDSSIEKTFQYLSQFEKYQERYSRYCAKFDIVKRENQTITTEEMWNMTMGDLAHVKVTVRYTLIPNNKIEFEILKGFGTGSKNSTVLEEVNGKTLIHTSLVPLEIYSKFYPVTDPVFQKMIRYFSWKDTWYLDGKQIETQDGDICPHCNEGRLRITGKREKIESDADNREFMEFKCEKCEKTADFHIFNF